MVIIEKREYLHWFNEIPLRVTDKANLIDNLMEEFCNYYSGFNFMEIEDDPVNYAIHRTGVGSLLLDEGVDKEEVRYYLRIVQDILQRVVCNWQDAMVSEFGILPVRGRLIVSHMRTSFIIQCVDEITLQEAIDQSRLHRYTDDLDLDTVRTVMSDFTKWLEEEEDSHGALGLITEYLNQCPWIK